MAQTLESPSSTDADTRPPSVADLRFSVVIPSYNRAHLIERAVESCLSQSVPPAEIVVVDDGSTDDTKSVVARFDTRVRYVHQENAGCSAARNRGVREATHEWIAFLDSDDRWDEHHLERMAAAIQGTGGGADLYFADSEFPPGPDGQRRTLWGLAEFAIEGDYELAPDGSDWVMRDLQPLMIQGSVFRRDAYDRDGGLLRELRTREDTHIFLRFGLGRPICAVDHPGVHFCFDDLPENRLTLAYPASGRVYLEATVRLYSDVLRQCKVRDRAHRRELRRRLGAAQMRLGRLDFRDRRYERAFVNFLRGFWTSPGTLPGMIKRTLLRLVP